MVFIKFFFVIRFSFLSIQNIKTSKLIFEFFHDFIGAINKEYWRGEENCWLSNQNLNKKQFHTKILFSSIVLQYPRVLKKENKNFIQCFFKSRLIDWQQHGYGVSS